MTRSPTRGRYCYTSILQQSCYIPSRKEFKTSRFKRWFYSRKVAEHPSEPSEHDSGRVVADNSPFSSLYIFSRSFGSVSANFPAPCTQYPSFDPGSEKTLPLANTAQSQEHRWSGAQSCHGVSGFVVGHNDQFFLAHELVGFQSSNDAVHGFFKVHHGHGIGLAPGGLDRGLVANIGNIGTRKPGRQSGQSPRNIVNPVLERDSLEMNLENLLATLQIRLKHPNLPINPGRVNAWSRISTRLVPASTTTPVEGVKPSISTKIWFKVFLRLSFPPMLPRPRWRPTASISSIKTIQGALARASLNKSRTREGHTPTNISIKSELLML